MDSQPDLKRSFDTDEEDQAPGVESNGDVSKRIDGVVDRDWAAENWTMQPLSFVMYLVDNTHRTPEQFMVEQSTAMNHIPLYRDYIQRRFGEHAATNMQLVDELRTWRRQGRTPVLRMSCMTALPEEFRIDLINSIEYVAQPGMPDDVRASLSALLSQTDVDGGSTLLAVCANEYLALFWILTVGKSLFAQLGSS